jgi:GDP-L-fucose synthase
MASRDSLFGSVSADNAVVLVTGGSGLVGKAIQELNARKKLPGTWIFASSKDADLRSIVQVRAMFEKYKPTHVLHLAALVGGLFINMKYKVEFLLQNLQLNNNILQCCHEFKVDRCLSMASTCIFPDKTSYPLDETMLHNGEPHPSNEGYAFAKRVLDVANRLYCEQYGCKFATIIPTNIFGPHDNYNLDDGHVIPGLIHKCYLAKRDGLPLTVWGSGKPLRQFLYSLDLAELLVWAVFNYNDTSAIIMAPDEEDEVSIGGIAEMIAEAMDFQGEIVYDTSKADGQFKKTASNKKLRGLLPATWKFTSMRTALKESVEWLVANYETARKEPKDASVLFNVPN